MSLFPAVRSLLAHVGSTEKWILTGTVAVVLLALTFAKLASEVLEGDTLAFDRNILLLFRSSTDSAVTIGPVWLKETMRDITALGGTTVLTIIALAVSGYLAVTGLRHAAGMVLASVVSGVLLSNSLKLVFARARPDIVPHHAAFYAASFPSGHTTLSAIVYLTLAALLCRTQSSAAVKGYILAVGVFLTFIVGISRIFLGVHWPTDVIAGWLVGSTWALLCWFAMLWLQTSGGVEPEQPQRPSNL